MNIEVKYLTNNRCYKSGKKITPKGIVVHSVGCAQHNREVFVRTWNNSSISVCVHAFVDNKGVTQTLPWNYRPWGCGSGSKGSYNNSHIQFEICEPSNVKYKGGQLINYNAEINEEFFIKCYNNAVELCIKLCKEFNLTEKDIVCHSEAHKLGYASNHSDVMHWFPKHGKSMDTFREDVRKGLMGGNILDNSIIYKVQVGAFKNKDNADKLSTNLINLGYSTYIIKVDNLYKVQVGAFKNRGNAQSLADKLLKDGYESWIVETNTD